MPENSRSRFIIEYGSKSDIGMVRSDNQDFFGKFPSGNDELSYPGGQLFIVADGMGGHERGREASEAAVNTFGEKYYSSSRNDIPAKMKEAMIAANEQVYRLANRAEGFVKMGTTCSALVISDKYAYIAHVGDSRIYRINSGGIEQLTQDHTQVAEMFRKGILSEQEAEDHPSKSVLVRALGVKPETEVDVIGNIELQADDYFLLCSDGLARVPLEDLRQTVLSHSPQQACEMLVGYANQLGGHDNVTVQIIEIGQKIVNSTVNDSKSVKKFKWNRIFLVIFLFLFIVLLAFIYSYRSSIDDRLSSIFSSDSSGVEVSPEISSSHENLAVPETVEESRRFVEAHRLFEKGNLDDALKIYLNILGRDPMNLESVKGIDRIAGAYKDRAREYRSNKDYQNAIIYFQKALELQPTDQQLQKAIGECREMLKKPASEIDSSITNPEREVVNITQGPAEPEVMSSQPAGEIDQIIPAGAGQWELFNLTANDYVLKNDGLVFLETNKAKKAIYNENLEDSDIEVLVKLNDHNRESPVGIIVGYQSASGHLSERYFQFSKITANEFVLEKKQEEQFQRLLNIDYVPLESEKPGDFHLKVKCLGPWIMMYYNNKLLKAWLSKELIRGKAGLFAGPNTYVVFSDFKFHPAIHQNDGTAEEPQSQENMR
ncbi:MAG: protein phosphatase 2C domain-containing protein [Calditrichaeota bacterium]|nr:protein phosphatase 2C domain-containing protein [Calditrichota bacterium]